MPWVVGGTCVVLQDSLFNMKGNTRHILKGRVLNRDQPAYTARHALFSYLLHKFNHVLLKEHQIHKNNGSWMTPHHSPGLRLPKGP